MSNFTLSLRSGVLLAAISAVALFAPASAGAQPSAPHGRPKTERFNGREVAAGEVIVKFSKSTPPQAVEHAKAAADVETDRAVGGRGARLFRSRSKNVETLVRELSARGDVVYAEPNYVVRVSAVPNDPSFADQWALQNTGSAPSTGAGTPGADIGAASAWDVSTGSRANVVAVIDTGVDSTHPDLAANMWAAPAPFTVNIAGQSITCAAGTHGFNAITKTCDPADDYNHGTHVAGIVGARGNNGVGGAGVNWTASIMDIKFMDATGNGTLSDALDAIEFAIQAKQTLGAAANVRVLNASWGWNGEPSQALLDQINQAAARDMLFVAGAGNGGEDKIGDSNDASPFYPASYDAPSVIAVAATDNNDRLASFSNYSPTRVHLAAPGVLVHSTIKGGVYDWWSGTSMAAPHVSGAAALVLSRCALDTAGLKNVLLMSVDYVPSLATATATSGRLDANRAIRTCAAPTPTPTPTPTITPTPTPTPTPIAGGSGTGTTGRLVKWSDGASGTLGDSIITEVGGKVGVGTTSPAFPFDVNGSGRIGQFVFARGFASPGKGGYIFNGLGGPGPIDAEAGFFVANDGTSGGTQDGPYFILRGNAFSRIPGQRGSVYFAAGGPITNPGPGEGAVTFQTGGLDRLTVTAAGNVGVGTTAPQSTLQVNGFLQLALTSGAPPAADCDAAAEYGRMKVDALSVKLYVCTAAGWKSAALQ